MKDADFHRLLLKAFGLSILFVAVLSIPKALSGTIAFLYWGYLSWSSVSETDFIAEISTTIASNQALEGLRGIFGMLFFGWFSTQVFKERPWILRFCRIRKAEQSGIDNPVKRPETP